MGLAQRFKDKLDEKSIFEKAEVKQSLESGSIKFISKPIKQNVTVQLKGLHSGVKKSVKNLTEPDMTTDKNSDIHNTSKRFEDLETEIIDKIRKIPYWLEYSSERQINMISSYFDKRCNTDFSYDEKLEFVENILALSNCS